MEGAGVDCSLPGAQRQDGQTEAEEAVFLGTALSQEPCGNPPVLERKTSEGPRDTRDISFTSLEKTAHFLTSQPLMMAKD